MFTKRDVEEEEHALLEHIRATSSLDELVRISEGQYANLLKLADDLFNESYSQDQYIRELETLEALSHKKMQSATPATLWAWRILYTDSCTLHSIAVLEASAAQRSIKLLDQAIIIAGGGDEDRLDLILSLIRKVQQKFLPLPKLPQQLLNSSHHSSQPLLSACNQVPSITTKPSFLAFQNIYSAGPFVIRGYARDWPALKERPWNSTHYLLSISGSSRLVPVEVGHDYRAEPWSQVLMDWERFIFALNDSEGTSKAARDGLYLAQYNLFRQFPALRNDIMIPDYVYCSLKPQDFSAYRAPENADGAILNVWLGPKGATSPAHFDPYHNLYVQVVGYKTVWLSPPQTTVYMESRHLNRAVEPNLLNAPPVLESGNISNTSQIDVFSLKNVDEFPEFSEKVIPQAMSVELGPGDLLFFPPGWWHGMRSESTSLSISMWF